MSFSVFIFITVLSSLEVQFRARMFVEGNILSPSRLSMISLSVVLPFH